MLVVLVVLEQEPPRELGAEPVELGTEDRLPVFLVREKEPDAATRRVQDGLDHGEDGCDAATARERNDLVVGVGEDERPCWRAHCERGALDDMVHDPIRDHAAGDPFDRHLQGRVDRRRRRHRVAPEVGLALDDDTQGDELAGFVRKRVGQSGWNIEDDRQRLGCLRHQPLHGEGVVAVAHHRLGPGRLRTVAMNWRGDIHRLGSRMHSSDTTTGCPAQLRPRGLLFIDRLKHGGLTSATSPDRGRRS